VNGSSIIGNNKPKSNTGGVGSGAKLPSGSRRIVPSSLNVSSLTSSSSSSVSSSSLRHSDNGINGHRRHSQTRKNKKRRQLTDTVHTLVSPKRKNFFMQVAKYPCIECCICHA
jgi:hypothetical protein